MRFFILDAFTDELFGGNPAGVVMVDEGEPFPEEHVMQSIAAELRYSETVFVRRESADEYCLRYFTVTDEVDLCGHATIAAFSVIFDLERGDENEGVPGTAASGLAQERRWTAVTKAGRLRVEKCGDFVFLDMAPPKDVAVIEAEDLLEAVYECVGLDYGCGRSAETGSCWLPEIISTGLPDIILPLRSTDLLQGLELDFPKMTALSERLGVTGVHAFSTEIERENGEIRVHCRNFAPLYGIDEEAATGTANGALTWYLYKKGVLGVGDAVCFIQGEGMKRPSKVYGRLSGEISVKQEAEMQCGDDDGGAESARSVLGGFSEAEPDGVEMQCGNDGGGAESAGAVLGGFSEAEPEGATGDAILLRIQIGGKCAMLAQGVLASGITQPT